MTTPTVETRNLQHCQFEAKVKTAGQGSPVVYLHTAGGPRWDEFLDALAQEHTVYAPDHPGTGETDRNSIHNVDTMWDLVLIYDEMLDSLGLDSVQLVGSSFGGMMACELAAHRPERVERLVLLDPIGLWLDETPVAPYMMMSQENLINILFKNLEAKQVQEFLTLPTDPKEQAMAMADSVWAMGATGKFVWPIPDKGLRKRIHRITAQTLIIWGTEDRLVSPVYADEFGGLISNARVKLIDGSGHVPQWEKLDEVAPLVLDFLR